MTHTQAGGRAGPEGPPGAGLAELVHRFGPGFLSEEACRAWLLEALHPDGARCPQCRAPVSDGQAASYRAGRKVACASCGRWFNAMTGTPLTGSKLDCRQLVLIALCLGLGLETGQAARLARVSPETVRAWRGRLSALETLADGEAV